MLPSQRIPLPPQHSDRHTIPAPLPPSTASASRRHLRIARLFLPQRRLRKVEKIADKINHHDSSSSSDSEKEEEKKTTSFMEAKIRRLFGWQQPVHKVLGGGKPYVILQVEYGETDAWLSMELMFHFSVLPLTRQLTNISDNLWCKTLQGARAQRVEYLLLHEFHSKNFIVPDKFYSKTRELKLTNRKQNHGGDGIRQHFYLQCNDAPMIYSLLPMMSLMRPPSTKKMKEGGIASTSTDSRETLNKAICTTTNMGAEFERSFPCLVKIYDSLESDLKLNDIFEFIGVLAFDTDLSKEKEDNNNVESSLCDDVLVELPPSKCYPGEDDLAIARAVLMTNFAYGKLAMQYCRVWGIMLDAISIR
nr:DNA polymerase alpha catalytic subunit [Ipomoea batatas]